MAKLLALVLPALAAAAAINSRQAPEPVQDGITPDCTKYYKVVSGDYCWAIAQANKIKLEDLYKWNPAIGSDCTNLWVDYNICVGAPGASTPFPEPTIPGINKDCKKFYKVKAGDTCSNISKSEGISLQELQRLNGLNDQCSNLWADYYVCTGL